MGTIVVQVKSTQAAHQLADFLKTIEYVDNVEHQANNTAHTEQSPSISITKGNYTATEKPSDFAGIWNNRRKVDARKLRKRAWQRKK
jgi:nitrate reductase assembly molybdenum cofactor insertion protein NarJ